MPKWWPVAFAAIVAILTVLAGLASSQDPVEGWQMAARWTARVGFPFFIITYSASSLLRLSPTLTHKALVKNRRYWGLSFALTHTVHLGALITYLQVSGETRPVPVLIGGGLGYVLLFAMALTSSDRAQKALGKNWKRLHTLGIHWLWAIFAFSYFGRAMQHESQWTGLIGTSIALLALSLRIAAWWKSRQARR